MKAVRITRPGGPEVLELVEVSDPAPGPGEALVRVRAAGVNRADLLQRTGRYPAPPGVPDDIPGLEFSGEVVEVVPAAAGSGSGVAADAAVGPGDRAMGLAGGGAYAGLIRVPTEHLLSVPDGFSFAEAAAIPEAFLTAADALFRRGRLLPGERALVHSAGGGVGTAALQLARLADAPVAGTASGAKLRRLEAAGLAPDLAVDYTRGSFAAEVREWSDGEGVDVILDTVGAPYWEDNVACLATLGRIVLVGVLGGARTEVDLRALMGKRATVVGTVLRARPREEKADLVREFSERFLPAFATDPPGLRPIVDRVFPLADAGAAHSYVADDRAFGKVILKVP